MPKATLGTENPEEIIKAALQDETVPHIYFNGVLNATSAGDMMSVLLVNGKPCAVLNMSYTVAKTLAIDLGQAISGFEATTDHTLMTVGEISAAMETQNGLPHG